MRASTPIEGLYVLHDLRKIELPERPWRNSRRLRLDLAGYEVLNAHR
jgi:hypothetical protein